MAPEPTRPSDKKEIGQDTRQREVRRAARRQGSTHAGQLTTTSQRLEGKKQKRRNEKTYVVLKTMCHRGSHALVQWLNREHVREVFPLSSLMGHTPKTGLQHLHKVTFSKCPSSVDPRGRAPPVRHGRTMWPENAFGVSDGVIHNRIVILRDEPSSERKDVLHILQYQLNLRHLSSTAVVSTQKLDLPEFPPHPGFPGSALVTRHEKSELSAHQNPCAGSTSEKIRSSNPWCRLTSALDSRRFPCSMDVVPSLRVLPSCLRSRLRRVQLVRCFT